MFHKAKQLPISLHGATKSEVRTQFAALCYRKVNDKTQILLVTSRGSGRWIVPKGWPMDEKTPAEGAAREAYEEAGVTGKAYPTCLGVFSYEKALDDDNTLPCLAMLYPVKVTKIHTKFPERKERRRKWFSLKNAAQKVDEPELRKIIKTFDPKAL